MKRVKKIIKILILIILVLIVLLFLGVKCINKYIFVRGADVLHSYAESNMFDILNSTVSYVLQKYENDGQSIVTINYNKDGTISYLNVDYNLANKIKSEISLLISHKLSHQDEVPVYVPVGVFTKNMYLMGKGPKIKFHMIQRGNIQSDFKESIKSGGINQTLYTLKLVFDADIGLVLPYCDINTTNMQTSVILSQMLINGDCPVQYNPRIYQGEDDDG